METNTELKMIHLSEVESQQIKWLWYPFIPYGKLSIVQGDPGDGKSMPRCVHMLPGMWSILNI